MPSVGQYYVEQVQIPRVVFDKMIEPELYEEMLGVFEDMRPHATAESPYDDVVQLRVGGEAIAWMIFPSGSHKRVVFFDLEELWALAEKVGAASRLRSFVQSTNLQPIP